MCVIASPNASNKGSKHPQTDRGINDWPQNCLKKNEKILSISTSPGGAKFCCQLFLWPVLICSSSRVCL